MAVDISKTLDKFLSRRTGEWLYKFQCSEVDCKRVFSIRRGRIESHHGLCGVHARYATQRRRAGYLENEIVRVGTLYSLFIANTRKNESTGKVLCKEEFEQLTNQRECVYCSSNLPWFQSYMCFMDKIDQAGDYTKENLVPCCHLCRSTKRNNFSHVEMLTLGKTIKALLEERVLRIQQT